MKYRRFGGVGPVLEIGFSGLIGDVIIGVRCSSAKGLFLIENTFLHHKSQVFFSQVLRLVLDTGRVCENRESQILVRHL